VSVALSLSSWVKKITILQRLIGFCEPVHYAEREAVDSCRTPLHCKVTTTKATANLAVPIAEFFLTIEGRFAGNTVYMRMFENIERGSTALSGTVVSDFQSSCARMYPIHRVSPCHFFGRPGTAFRINTLFENSVCSGLNTKLRFLNAPGHDSEARIGKHTFLATDRVGLICPN